MKYNSEIIENEELNMRERDINRYYDSLRDDVYNDDYSMYDYPEVVVSAKIDEIEASRAMVIEDLYDEYRNEG